MIRRIVSPITLLVGLFAAVCLSGCAANQNNTLGSTGGGGIGQLYVSESSANSVLRFSPASTATGGATPAATLAGTTTQLQSPQSMLLDETNNRLFVANAASKSVLIFESAASKTGNAAPDRTIAGSLTTLSAPLAVALDRSRDFLYVADGVNILVFNSASTVTGNVAPARTLNVGFTAEAILLDQTNDRLFVADSGHDAVDVFDNASIVPNTSPAANRILSGTNTALKHPSGLGLDATGRLVVSNLNAPNVTIYAGAATVNGNVAPTATLSGSDTGLVHPAQIALNNNPGGGDSGDVYVADNSANTVIVFTNIGAANGNVTPARTITGVAGVKGVALDTTR